MNMDKVECPDENEVWKIKTKLDNEFRETPMKFNAGHQRFHQSLYSFFSALQIQKKVQKLCIIFIFIKFPNIFNFLINYDWVG